MKIYLLCSLLAVSGCNANQPSLKNNYYTDYVLSQSYVLKQPVFFPKDDKSQLNFLTKIGEGSYVANPDTLEEYQKNPTAWDVELLPVGTTVKITKLEYTSSFDAGPHIWINAQILNGKLSGKKCLLNYISRKTHKDEPLIDVPMVDTNILDKL